MNIYTINLEILTPVFIGTGEELDALSYVLRNEGKRSFVYIVNSGKWFSDHSDEPDVYKTLREYNYIELRRILSRAKDIENYVKTKILVDTDELVSLYKDAINYKRNENELRINLLPRNPINGRCYIPGSSIKGAIRTAMGSFLAKAVEQEAINRCSERERRKEKCYSTFNKIIFGDAKQDVFKNLKIGDALIPLDGTKIVKPIEVGLNENKTPVPKGYVEVISPFNSSQERIKTKMCIGDFLELHYVDEINRLRKLKKFKLEDMISALNKFYVAKFNEEMRKFYNLPHLASIKNNLQSVAQKINNLKNNSNKALIRIGHFSHVECVTWDEVRKPKGRKINNKNVYGTTRTLANGMYPFGWVLLSFENGYNIENMDMSLEKENENSGYEDSTDNSKTLKGNQEHENILQYKLDSLKSRLYAIPQNQRAGSLPNIAKEILSQDDEEYKSKAKQIILSFIEEIGWKKKVKNKNWFKKLVE